MWRPSPTHRSSAAAFAALALAAGCGTKSTSHVISVSGRIGPLQVDRSDREDVIRFAGKPSVDRRGRMGNAGAYRALGYDCTARNRLNTMPVLEGGPYCRTAYFLERRTRKLVAFFTTAPAFSESHGIRVGTPQRTAERLLHRRLTVGCLASFFLSSPRASLSISFGDGTENGTSIKGARVDAFVLHSRHDDLDLFDCL
jgi:hypothetical protein